MKMEALLCLPFPLEFFVQKCSSGQLLPCVYALLLSSVFVYHCVQSHLSTKLLVCSVQLFTPIHSASRTSMCDFSIL